MACSTGCPTQDHETYGQCMREKGGRVLYANSAKGFDATKEKAWNSELDLYRKARSEGIQPEGTTRAKVEAAMRISDMTGSAYQAGA